MYCAANLRLADRGRHACDIRIREAATVTRSDRLTVLFDGESDELDHVVDHFDAEPGVDPVTAASSATALERLRSAEVDCLVTDGLGTGDGRPLFEAARDVTPGVPTVLYTADTPQNRSSDAVDAVVENTEPGSLDALRAVVGLVTRPADLRPSGTGDRHGIGDRYWRVLGYYDWETTSDPVTTLLLALAAERGVDVLELEPVYDVVDTDALNRLFTADVDTADPLELEFRYEGMRIHVTSDGLVACR